MSIGPTWNITGQMFRRKGNWFERKSRTFTKYIFSYIIRCLIIYMMYLIEDEEEKDLKRLQ